MGHAFDCFSSCRRFLVFCSIFMNKRDNWHFHWIGWDILFMVFLAHLYNYSLCCRRECGCLNRMIFSARNSHLLSGSSSIGCSGGVNEGEDLLAFWILNNSREFFPKSIYFLLNRTSQWFYWAIPGELTLQTHTKHSLSQSYSHLQSHSCTQQFIRTFCALNLLFQEFFTLCLQTHKLLTRFIR